MTYKHLVIPDHLHAAIKAKAHEQHMTMIDMLTILFKDMK